ncbi:MAG: winged helix-turn-helix domain-containing protein [Planctomycetota bacterium]|jgi:DNA-binding transcriptional ArsR family regulator
MIDKIITSRTRAKLLKLFLNNIDDRYYLRELERRLDESLSPLRRQLVKLTKMGILIIEEEGNLKYYRLNKDFAGIEELRRLVLGREFLAQPASSLNKGLEEKPGEPVEQKKVEALRSSNNKHARYDIVVLTIIAFFVLATAVFVVYTSTRNIKEVAGLISETSTPSPVFTSRKATATRPDEMISRHWKVLPGGVPALSSRETGGGIDRSKEL